MPKPSEFPVSLVPQSKPKPVQAQRNGEAHNSCATCKFFQPHRRAQEGTNHRGNCLRYPPTVNGVVGKSSVYPTVSATEWCGEFEQTS